MRANVTFDTLEYMDLLKKSGMKQIEAEAITKATSKALNQMMDTKDISTKKDLKELEVCLKKDLKALEVSLKKDVNETKLEVSKAINETKLEMVKVINDTKIELLKYVSDNTWKTIGILATFQTIILGVFGLLQYAIKYTGN